MHSELPVLDFQNQSSAKNASLMAERLNALKQVTPIAGQTPIQSEGMQKEWGVDQVIPEIQAKDFNIGHLKSAIASKGLLIVRNFMPEQQCSNYCEIIDNMLLANSSEARKKDIELDISHLRNIASNIDTFFPFEDLFKSRSFQQSSGSAMVMESSSLALHLMELYEGLGLKKVLAEYLGDEPCLSVKKWMLRRSLLPVNPNGWHQDGSFMGSDINSLNMWLPLTKCGANTGAPGLDIVPYRFKETVPTGTEGAAFKWSISLDIDQLNMPENKPVSPSFNAGDALFFDHFSLHRTQFKEESFSKSRYAIETWFFGETNFPKNQIPVKW